MTPSPFERPSVSIPPSLKPLLLGDAVSLASDGLTGTVDSDKLRDSSACPTRRADRVFTERPTLSLFSRLRRAKYREHLRARF